MITSGPATVSFCKDSLTFSFDESIKAYEYLMEYDVFGKIVVEIKN